MNKIIQLLCVISLFGSSAHAMYNQEELNEQLIRAAGLGYLSHVQELITAGANVNTQEGINWTPIMCAACNNHFSICRLLVASNAKVNARDNSGTTPLMLASREGNLDVCRYLLENKAQINAQDSGGWTPLIYAAARGHTDMCKYLIANEADIHSKTNRGATALKWAAFKSHIDTCTYLADSMLKQRKAAAIVFLGIKKFRNIVCISGVDSNVIKIIARQAFNARKQDLFAQIHGIENEEIRQYLLDHVKRQLQSHQTMQNEAPETQAKKPRFLDINEDHNE